MRVRKVVNRSGKKFRGKFPSKKVGRMIQWESLLERDAILWFEYHPSVAMYAEQPRVLLYYDKAGQQHKYVPDFRIELRNGTTVEVEVKPFTKLADRDVAAKLACIALQYQQMGANYRILTEREIRAQPRFSVFTALHRAATQLVCLNARQQWLLSEAADLLGATEHVRRLFAHDSSEEQFRRSLDDESLNWLKDFNPGENHDPLHI